jgi:hypothetical protein
MPLQLHSIIGLLLVIPITYFAAAYAYLAWWHRKAFLWSTVVHENGRLTLMGSLFYFDHFLGCLPMIVVFALCVAGGLAMNGRVPYFNEPYRAANIAAVLLGIALLMVLASFAASIMVAGWERTIDYALQRIERDGVLSRGGNWNQQQLSNIPIALGAIGLSNCLTMLDMGYGSKRDAVLSRKGKICIGLALALTVIITAITFPGWQSFLNARWVAHSIREMATYPLTGIPIALAGILLVERYISHLDAWLVKPRSLSLILIGAGILILFAQLVYLSNVDVLGMAQKPAFAEGGLSVFYLLFSHVFEHFLDFVFIAPLAGGIYALARWLGVVRLR